MVEKSLAQRELSGSAGKRERRGAGRLGEIRATGRLLGVHLLPVTRLRKQLLATV